MATTTAYEYQGAVERHNRWVLDNARMWTERGYAVRVQIQPGERPCRSCRNNAGTYRLDSLPVTPHPGCERIDGCNCVYHLILV